MTPYGKIKIKQPKKQIDFGIFFVRPKNKDIDYKITNVLDFQIFYLESLGYYTDIAINKNDILAKCQALGISKFISIELDHLVHWDKLINWITTRHLNTAIGTDKFYYASTEYAEQNQKHSYEYKLKEYNTIEPYNLIENIKTKKYFSNHTFHYAKLSKKIIDYKCRLIYLPEEGKRTKDIRKSLEDYDCVIKIYKRDLYTTKSNLEWIDEFSWLNKNSQDFIYLDTGCNFVDFDKSIFYGVKQRSEMACNFVQNIINVNKKVMIGGVFPWGGQVKFEYPQHQNWMHFPWNIPRY
jgi:hypothetical protein